MRVSQGGHDIPDEKLLARFERTQTNLKRAIECLPHVIVYSNENLCRVLINLLHVMRTAKVY